MRAAVLLCAVLAVLAPCAQAGLRLRSVLPTSYTEGAPLQIKTNSLTSHTKVMPMPWASMPWCNVDAKERKMYKMKQNLGEILWGSQIEPSLFKVAMRHNITCAKLCDAMPLTAAGRKMLKDRIEDNYRGNLVLDGLPVAEEGSGVHSAVATGFPLGVSKKHSASGKTIVHNHLAFNIKIHEPNAYLYIPDGDEPTQDTYRVVGFEVAPLSIDHSKTACTDHMSAANGLKNPVTTDAEEILWTYSVAWEDSDVEWASRWDAYLKSTKVESRIHWAAILNSTLVVLLLTAIIAIIFVSALKKDLARYNDPEALEEERTETGWKLVHGDVFRKPEAAGLLAIYIGSGVQLFGMAFVVLLLAMLGFTSPTNRGSLFTVGVFLFVILGGAAGYTTARFAKFFHMKSWKIIFAVGLYLPGQIFFLYFLLNFVHWGSHAASATPFTAILTLAALWFCVSLPLVLLGGAIGYRQDEITVPRKVNNIPRSIPPLPWYLQYPQSVLGPGVLPFGAAFIESVFILSSIWQGRVYYVFGFLGLVFLILTITCAEATMVMTYFQLLNLDYHWWWHSFFTSASYGFWLFAYSAFYYATALSIRSWWSSVLYFGYMAMVSYVCAVLTGTIGFVSAFLFVRKIYGSIKVD